jgi:hypothetical protein
MAVRLLRHCAMRSVAAVAVIASLLFAALPVQAQAGVGIESALPPQQLEQRPPPPPRTRPSAPDANSGRHSGSTPTFIGPTTKTETTEFGFSGGSPRTRRSAVLGVPGTT